jgi:hypothetical protein
MLADILKIAIAAAIVGLLFWAFLQQTPTAQNAPEASTVFFTYELTCLPLAPVTIYRLR